MKTRSPILRGALAGLLAAAIAAPAATMPAAVPDAPPAPSDVVRVQDRGALQNPGYHGHWPGHVYGGYGGYGIYGGGGTGHEMVPDPRVPPYWGGYQGYRYARPGYRYHDGWWFPPAAFALGAFITGAINQSARSSASLHVEWCYDNYRSYRAWDNTFQPNRGPRKQCNSPYR